MHICDTICKCNLIPLISSNKTSNNFSTISFKLFLNKLNGISFKERKFQRDTIISEVMFILHVLVFVAKTLVLSQACSSNPKEIKCYECPNCTYVSYRNIRTGKGELVQK